MYSHELGSVWKGAFDLQLSQHLTGGEGSLALIIQLVGCAIEQTLVKPLDAEKQYDFLRDSVRERLAEMEAQKLAVKELTRFANDWLPTASEADLLTYFERWKLYGENGAMLWLKQRQGGD